MSMTQPFQLQASEADKWVRLAAAFLKEDDTSGAEGAAEVAVAANPNHAQAHVVLGISRAKQKRFSDAVPSFLRAVELDPQDLATWTDLGECYISMLRYPQAADALKKAMELDPKAEHPAGRRARAIVGRTIMTLQQKS